jgi:hypothetical protein
MATFLNKPHKNNRSPAEIFSDLNVMPFNNWGKKWFDLSTGPARNLGKKVR